MAWVKKKLWQRLDLDNMKTEPAIDFNSTTKNRGFNKMQVKQSLDFKNPSVKKMQTRHNFNNSKGIVTIPFLLVLIIMLFFILSFLFLSLTLSHVSITQYLSYSTARKLSLSGESLESQSKNAHINYNRLRSSLFKDNYTGKPGDWFNIRVQLGEGDIGSLTGSEYYEDNDFRNRFYGVHVVFQPKMLKLNIPFLVSSKGTSDLKARISTFLGREPSQEECREFHKQKLKKIRELCSGSDCPNIKEAVFLDDHNGDNDC